MIRMKDVEGYIGRYKVTEDGRVWSCLSNKWLSPCKGAGGYRLVSLGDGVKYKSLRVHRLVAGAFLTKQPHHTEVNHKDKNVGNNNVKNLEWCTRKENLSHQYGFQVGNSKLRRINKLIESGVAPDVAKYALQ